MGNLFTTLLGSSNALSAYSQGLQVVENNVTNASTPGYAAQTASFKALPFDIGVGLPGGVMAGPAQSSRSAYAEQNVRNQQTTLGSYQQTGAGLEQIQTLFGISGTDNISSGIDGLFNSFSQLSVNPNDTPARQNVLDSASQLAQQFNQAANGLGQALNTVEQQTEGAVASINQLAGTIAQINGEHPRDYQGNIDAGLDAQMNNALEQLSQYANYTALQQPDGSVNVYIGGQSPLVMSSQAEDIQADFSSGQAVILNSQGSDITSQITGGQLAGGLSVYNSLIPSYTSSLNMLAQGIADQVNGALASGVDESGSAPATNLFSYNASAAARTIAVNPLTPSQIAAALPGAPGGNGNALALSALGSATALSGQTFTQFYGTLAARTGQDVSNAQNGETTSQQLLTQAQTLRSQVSGVSLDKEAEQLIQFQSAYQAVSKMISVLNNLTLDVINMIPPASS